MAEATRVKSDSWQQMMPRRHHGFHSAAYPRSSSLYPWSAIQRARAKWARCTRLARNGSLSGSIPKST